jgi:hypothetical protein
VAAVTERVNAQLAKNKLCVKSAESTDNMESAEFNYRSLLQFVQWPLFMPYKYIVPALPSTGWHGPPFCRIYSPWIDLVVERKPVPRIFGIVRWNERQLLADQAVLDGAKNVPPGVVMPLSSSELGHFTSEYRKSAAKPVEERVPPDILWLFLRTWPYGIKVSGFPGEESASMYRAVEKGAEGYTKLVLALVDRCFAPSASGKSLHYTNILDAADLIPLEQYKIDMPIRHRPR